MPPHRHKRLKQQNPGVASKVEQGQKVDERRENAIKTLLADVAKGGVSDDALDNTVGIKKQGKEINLLFVLALHAPQHEVEQVLELFVLDEDRPQLAEASLIYNVPVYNRIPEFHCNRMAHQHNIKKHRRTDT